MSFCSSVLSESPVQMAVMVATTLFLCAYPSLDKVPCHAHLLSASTVCGTQQVRGLCWLNGRTGDKAHSLIAVFFLPCVTASADSDVNNVRVESLTCQRERRREMRSREKIVNNGKSQQFLMSEATLIQKHIPENQAIQWRKTPAFHQLLQSPHCICLPVLENRSQGFF